MSPWLTTVLGQTTAVATLRRALASGRVHHAYLFDGPDGVGKERAALGLAQALVCERRQAGEADACSACRACLRALPRSPDAAPLHPDVVIIARGFYEPATIGRRTPETQDISIDQVRTLVLARSAFSPYEGRAKVFIVRRAEELSTSAANALLKTLEEPGAQTHFILLSSAADSLLPTIRSRTQRVRFGPLPDDAVASVLMDRGLPATEAAALSRLSNGSVATALGWSDPQAIAAREDFAARAVRALDSASAGPAFELAEDGKKVSKEVVLVQVRALAAALAEQGRAAASLPDSSAARAAARYGLALSAVEQIEANASVQLALEAMLLRMRAVP
jgi:DNA polymerase-3 subunit delta'